MMTPKVKLSQYNRLINIFRAVKFILKYESFYKHDMHEVYI